MCICGHDGEDHLLSPPFTCGFCLCGGFTLDPAHPDNQVD